MTVMFNRPQLQPIHFLLTTMSEFNFVHNVTKVKIKLWQSDLWLGISSSLKWV